MKTLLFLSVLVGTMGLTSLASAYPMCSQQYGDRGVSILHHSSPRASAKRTTKRASKGLAEKKQKQRRR